MDYGDHGITLYPQVESAWYRTTNGRFSGISSIKVKHGDHGITAITPVCGTGNEGSIPSGRPNSKKSTRMRVFLLLFEAAEESKVAGGIQDERSECLSTRPGRKFLMSIANIET